MWIIDGSWLDRLVLEFFTIRKSIHFELLHIRSTIKWNINMRYDRSTFVPELNFFDCQPDYYCNFFHHFHFDDYDVFIAICCSLVISVCYDYFSSNILMIVTLFFSLFLHPSFISIGGCKLSYQSYI